MLRASSWPCVNSPRSETLAGNSSRNTKCILQHLLNTGFNILKISTYVHTNHNSFSCFLIRVYVNDTTPWTLHGVHCNQNLATYVHKIHVSLLRRVKRPHSERSTFNRCCYQNVFTAVSIERLPVEYTAAPESTGEEFRQHRRCKMKAPTVHPCVECSVKALFTAVGNSFIPTPQHTTKENEGLRIHTTT